ncbi:MAG: hypothetical protein ACKOCK_05135, partial [Chloroflexota bacterium]
ELSAIFAQEEVDPHGIARVLALLDQYDIQVMVESHVRQFHDDARSHLLTASAPGDNPYRDELLNLVDRLSDRQG